MNERAVSEAKRQEFNRANTKKLLLYFDAVVKGRDIEISPGRAVDGKVLSAAMSQGKQAGEINFNWTEEVIPPSVTLVEEGGKKRSR